MKALGNPVAFTLTAQQTAAAKRFAAFAQEHVAPHADRWDREQALPDQAIRHLADERHLVATLPREAGGAGLDQFTWGLLNEQLGRSCGSVRNLVAVQGMVAHAILKWGSRALADRWVPAIGAGQAVAAFALTEPDAGSDARHGVMTAEHVPGGYLLNGRKAWISYGARANVYLVFARLDGDAIALVVERGTPGLSVTPQRDLLGLRASALAELSFDGCEVPADNMLSHGRLTFDAVATTALDYGRYSVAWGCTGLAGAALDASLVRARERVQFGVPIGEHQLVQRLLAIMATSVRAARLLCCYAGTQRDEQHLDAVPSTLMAKYFASTAAFRVAADAVQIHGAAGCSADAPVQRYLRDAKIQEIIEGTSEIQQVQIGQLMLRSH